MQLGATLLMVQWSTGWVRAAVKGAVRGPGGRCIPCTTARHWVARALLSLCRAMHTGAALRRVTPQSSNGRGLHVRVGWVCVDGSVL